MLILFFVAWHLLSNDYGEEEKALRSQLRHAIKKKFPERSTAFLQTYGLYSFETGKILSQDTVNSDAGIVLVHGLDEPGKVWQNLAPELFHQGDEVWLMNYPNDQPVVESADLLFEELIKIRSFDVRRISIVAHSMGGLVCREMLTRPSTNYRNAIQKSQVPRVDMLIMVGTPNHGSQMARFRVFSEVRDHFLRLTKGDADWLGIVLDGAGEAKIDLLPGSHFLTELNARPHPQGTALLSIAGILSPWQESDIRRWQEEIEDMLPDDHHAQVDAWRQQLIAMTHGLGDGLVTVESTRLEGVPHQTVPGTHLTMIRNITPDSRRVPPAVPIIVDQLHTTENKDIQ
jgi:pimeloyl-ACP methyl ester carboxylesterase